MTFPTIPVSVLSGFIHGSTHETALAVNQQLYNQALAGDKAALAELFARSPKSVGGQGAIARVEDQQDAYNKYLQVRGGAGAAGGAPVSSGVQLASAPGLLDKLLDVLGLGPTRQAQLAQTAGAAAGGQVADSIRFAVLVVAGIVVLLVVLRALRR